MAVWWRKHPRRMSSRVKRVGGTPRACNAQTTLARDCSVRGRQGGQCLAHMGEPEA